MGFNETIFTAIRACSECALDAIIFGRDLIRSPPLTRRGPATGIKLGNRELGKSEKREDKIVVVRRRHEEVYEVC